MTNARITSVEQLVEFFISIESKYNLLEWEVSGVKVWLHRRMSLYYRIAEDIGLLEKHKAKTKTTAKNKDHVAIREKDPKARKKHLERKLFKLLFKKALFGGYLGLPCSTAIFSHGRVIENNNRNVDPYIDPLIAKSNSDRKRVLILNSAKEIQHKLEEAYGNVLFIDFHNFIRTDGEFRRDFVDYLKINGKYKLNKADKELVDKLSEDFQNLFKGEVTLDLDAFVQRSAIFFKMEVQCYKLLFRIRRIKKLVITTSYFKMPLVKAANELGINVVEVQHGTMSPYHLGYSFPIQPKDLTYFPDEMQSWGEYWKKTTPIFPCKYNVIGNLFFRERAYSYNHIERKHKTLIVLSQPVITKQLLDIVINNKRLLENFNIIYKLHPFEKDLVGSNPAFKELASWPNIRIEPQGDLYQLLAEATYALGVFSTALFEAIGFGCKLILVNLPGVEYMRPLIDNYGVPLLHKNDELDQAISNARALPAEEFL